MSTWMSDDLRDAVQRARDAARQVRDAMPSLHGEIDLAVRDLDEAEACGDDTLGRSILAMANARIQVIAESLTTPQADGQVASGDVADGPVPPPMPVDGAEKPCDQEGCDGTLRFSPEVQTAGAEAQAGWVCSSGDASHFVPVSDTWPPSSLNA